MSSRLARQGRSRMEVKGRWMDEWAGERGGFAES